MVVPRMIELSVTFLAAFVVVVVISFLSLRSDLQEFRSEAGSEWEAFVREVRARNRLLSGLTESIRRFETGHAQLAEKVLEARAVSDRSSDPSEIVAAADDIDSCLREVEKLVQARPQMLDYPPFAGQWRFVVPMTCRINGIRKSYNANVRAYNRLLHAFPQNVLATLFGFARLNEYPAVSGKSP